MWRYSYITGTIHTLDDILGDESTSDDTVSMWRHNYIIETIHIY